MENKLLERAKAFLKAHHNQNIWYRIMCVLASLVVFVTTYMLILPAITMEKETYCGLEEHIHTEDCYQIQENTPDKILDCTYGTLQVHQHTDSCYDENNHLICDQAAYILHTHDANCYNEGGVLVCTLPEIKAHQHTDSCYLSEQVLVCGQQETAGHTHDSGCYTKERGSLICAAEEHAHSESCYDENGNLVCGLQEHQHQDDCYQWAEVLTCGQTEQAAHTHSAGCYETRKTLICGYDKLKVSSHQHTEACFREGTAEDTKILVCGMTEHQHSEVCYQENAADLLLEQEAQNAGLVDEDGLIEDMDSDVPLQADGSLPEAGRAYGIRVAALAEESEEETIVETGLSTEDVDAGSMNEAEVETEKETEISTETEIIGETETEQVTETEIQTEIESESEMASEEATEQETENSAALTSDTEMDEEETETETFTEEMDLGVMLFETGEESVALLMTDNNADLGQYITAVSGTGTEYDKQTDYFTTNLNIEFKMTKEQAAEAGNTFTFTYPQGIVVPDSLLNTEHTGYDDNKKEAFTYQFVKNEDGTYSVTVKLLDTYLAGVQDGSEMTGYISFKGKLAGDFLNNQGQIEKVFTDKVTLTIDAADIEYEEGETRNNDLKIVKSGQYVEGNILRYTVTVKSAKGTPAEITLEDIWSASNLDISKIENVTVQQQSYVVFRSNSGWSSERTEGDLTGVTADYSFNADSNTLTMTLPQVTGTTQEQTDGIDYYGTQYVIQYDYPLENVQEGVYYQANNTVTAESKDDTKGENLSATANCTVNFSVELLKKSGTYSNGTITWEITVNPGKKNIAGYVLTDDMLNNLSSAAVTISPNENFNIVTDENGKVSSIKFTAPENGTENKNCYTVTYSVPVSSGWNPQVVTNTVILDPSPDTSGDESKKEASVTVPGSGSVEKSLVMAGDAVDGKEELSWKFSISVPEGGTPADLLISDTLTGSTGGDSTDHYMTIEQVREWAELLGKNETDISDSSLKWLSKVNADTLQLLKTDGSPVKYADVKDSAEGLVFTGFSFNLKESLSQGDTVELTYKSYADISGKQNDTTYYYKNLVKAGEKSQEAQHTWIQKSNVHKMDGNGAEGNTVTSSSDGVVVWNVKVILDEDLGSGTLTIKDSLPTDGEGNPLVELESLVCGGQYWPRYAAVIAENGTITLSDGSAGIVLDPGCKYDSDTGEIVLTVTKKDGESPDYLKKGNEFWITYTCRIKDLPESGSQTYTLINRVDVTKNGNVYGSDDQTQEHTVDVAQKVIKMDGQKQEGTTVTSSEDGIVQWKVKINLNDDFSELNISDQLPVDSEGNPMVNLQSIQLGDEYNQNGLIISGESIASEDSSALDLTGSTYKADTGELSLKIKVKEGQNRPNYFSKNNALWLVYTCKVVNMPQPGEKVTYNLKNKVIVTTSDGSKYGESEQTQNHTVEVPPRVVKMDGNNQASDSTTVSSDGLVSWKVRVKLEDDYEKLIITDQLPLVTNGPNVELRNLYFGSADSQFEAIIAEDGTISSGEDSVLDFSGSTYNSETGKIELEVQVKADAERPSYFSKGQDFWLVYTCKLKELPASGGSAVHTLKNTVEVKINDSSEVYGKDEQTQTHTVTTPQVDKIDKNGEWKNNERLLKYSIDINPEAEDLLEGNDTLTLEDILKYSTDSTLCSDYARNVSLIQNSVQLYYAKRDENGNLIKDADGHLVAGSAVPSNLWKWQYEVSEKNLYASRYEKYHKIIVQIPDKEALVLKYNYQVQIIIPTDWNKPSLEISNSASLSGVSSANSSDSTSESWEESETSGGITSDEKREYVFYKVDSEDYALGLSGAEFTLYKYAPAAEGADSEGYVSTGYVYTTQDGRFSVEYGVGYTGFAKNTAYYVQETKAPSGYLMPDDPRKFYFHFPDSDDETDSYPTEGSTVTEKAAAFTSTGAIDLTQNSHTEYCANTKNATQITVNKKWISNSGQEVTDETTGSVTVDLYRKESDTNPEESSKTGSSGPVANGNIDFSISITLNGNDWWKESITKSAGTTAIFSITDIYGDKSKPDILFNRVSLQPTATVEEDFISSWGTTYKSKVYQYTVLLNEQTNVLAGNVAGNSWDDWKYSDLQYEESSGSSSVPPSGGTRIGSYTISSENGWTKVIDNLPKQGIDEDGNTVYYTYYVLESNSGNYTVSYSNEDGIVSGTITVTNTEKDTPDTSVTVTKLWEEGGISFTGTHSDIAVELWKKGDTQENDTKIADAVLSASSTPEWTYTWENLEEGEYYVKEINSPGGYTTTYSCDRSSAVTVGSAITITNIRQTTNLRVSKKWKLPTEEEGVYLNDTDLQKYISAETVVTLRLYGSTVSPSNGGVTDRGILNNDILTAENSIDYGTVQVGASNQWSYEWTSLPAKNLNGDPYYYYVVEENTSNCICVENNGTEGTVSDDSSSITVINEVPTTFITVEKKWVNDDTDITSDPSEESHPQSVSVQLYQKETNTPYGDPVTLTGSQWSYTWENLPEGEYYVLEVDPPEGFAISYRVEDGETSVENAVGSQIAAAGKTITVTNTKLTSVTVEKRWLSADGTAKDITNMSLPEITVKLFRVGETQQVSQIVLGSTHKNQAGYDDTGWSYTWTDLTSGTYYVEEEAIPTGYAKVVYQTETEGESENTSQDIKASETASEVTVESGKIIMNNYEEPTGITVEKHWDDNSYSERPASVNVKLYRSTTNVDAASTDPGEEPEDGTTYMDVTVTINNWYDSNGTAVATPTEGHFWVGFHASDENGNVTQDAWSKSECAESDVTYDSASRTWTHTFTLPATKTENGVTTVYYYWINPSSEVKDADWTVIANSENIQYSNGSQLISGIQSHYQVTMDAKLKSASSGDETEGETETEAENETESETGGGSGGSGNTGQTITIVIDKWYYGTQYGGNEAPVPTAGSVEITYREYQKEESWKYSDTKIMLTATDAWQKKIFYSAFANDCSGVQICPYTTYDASDGSGIQLYFGGDNEGNYVVSDGSGKNGYTLHGIGIVPYPSSETSMQAEASLVEITSVRTLSNENDLKLPEDRELVEEVTLNSENSWMNSWTNLDKTDSQGNTYYYYIVEEVVPENYEESYSYTYNDSDPLKGISKVDITNTLQGQPTETTTNITVQKYWKNSDGQERSQSSGSVTFKLMQKNVLTNTVQQYGDVYTITNSGEVNVWQVGISELPLSATDVSGNKLYEYVYYVEEVSVNGKPVADNFDVSYSNNAGIFSGTIIITNQDKQTYTLPETGGSGTWSYTVGGLLLSAMACLLLYIKNKRRKEEGCSS